MTVKELVEALIKAPLDKKVKITDTNGNLVADIFTVDQDDDNVYIVFEE